MTAPSFAARKATYAQHWADMKVENAYVIDKAARILIASKARYQAVAQVIGIPWFFIACCHWREASGSFAGVLHNGEKIIGKGVKTKLVPKGRGPFATWEAAAIDALKIQKLDKVRMDTVERFAYEAEAYNGWGYFNHGVSSAYLWSYSSIYTGGKYVSDGKWSSIAKDQQIGVMPLLKRMMVLDASIRFGGAPPDIEPFPATEPNGPVGGIPRLSPAKQKPSTTPATPLQKGAGGAVGIGVAVAAAKQAGLPWVWIAVGVVVVVLVGVAVWSWHSFRK